MIKYKIEITETLSKIVEIEACSEEEAIENALSKYRSEEIVLDDNDLIDVSLTKYENESE